MGGGSERFRHARPDLEARIKRGPAHIKKRDRKGTQQAVWWWWWLYVQLEERCLGKDKRRRKQSAKRRRKLPPHVGRVPAAAGEAEEAHEAGHPVLDQAPAPEMPVERQGDHRLGPVGGVGNANRGADAPGEIIVSERVAFYE